MPLFQGLLIGFWIIVIITIFLFYRVELRAFVIPRIKLNLLLLKVLASVLLICIVLFVISRVLKGVSIGVWFSGLPNWLSFLIKSIGIALIGRLVWEVLKAWFRFIMGAPVIQSIAMSTSVFGGFMLPLPRFTRRKKNRAILLAADGIWEPNPWYLYRLYTKLNAIAPTDIMQNPCDLSNTKYGLFIILGTRELFTRGDLYFPETTRDDIVHPAIIDFLSRGNYVIATHDCRAWFGQTGTFGPPVTRLTVSPARKHFITKGVTAFIMGDEEGSRIEDEEAGILSIRVNRNADVKGTRILFEAEDLESHPEVIRGRFPAAWLLKFRDYQFNVFYLFLGHSVNSYRVEEYFNVIVRAAKYFSKK